VKPLTDGTRLCERCFIVRPTRATAGGVERMVPHDCPHGLPCQKISGDPHNTPTCLQCTRDKNTRERPASQGLS
jgi:hypothetical protein